MSLPQGLGRVRPTVIVVLLAAVALGAGETIAQEERRGFLDRALDSRIDQALQKAGTLGAEIYNDGDAVGCCRLLEGALTAVQPFLEHRPTLERRITQGLKDAQLNPRPTERAFMLREVLDNARAALRPGTRTAKISPKVVTSEGLKLSAREQKLLDLTNQAREREELPPLRPNARLFQAARSHSANMARQDKLAHELDDKKPEERIREAGYHGITWGENIAGGMPTPADAIEVWMNSEAHKANILSPQYTEIGIGIATDERGVPFYTQVFGAPFRR